jgi:uncharacterized protein with NAD-binding domain and iron-sulfur cluster
MNKPSVTIVGGGLAGMVAAWRLLEQGCDVSLFEASGRWGGKAGATQQEGTFVNLLDSRYGISFIDVSQTWGTHGTTLNLIASDVRDLETLSPLLAVSALMEDLRRYLPPFGLEDVERITFQSHMAQPLFMNDVGGWGFRPETRTQMKNLYLAGDFCRTPIDLVSMEGAVSSALAAAEAIRSDLGIGTKIQNPLPSVYPRWLLVLG